MFQKITFVTTPNLKSSFQQCCDLNCISMAEKIEILTKEYLNQTLSLEFLRENFAKIQNQSPKEKREFKLTIQIDAELYLKLKENLKETRIRPSTFFNFVMAHFITNSSKQEIYAQKARILLESNDLAKDIKHIVYGLHFYKPVNDTTELVHTEYFLDLCSENKFYERYKNNCSELVYVLAVHK